MATELRLAVNKLNGSVRHETFAGRDYLIAPVIAIVAGVLNGELVPADEIAKFPESWSGIPVPLGHPAAQGQFVSANSPEIVARTPARFFNPEFSDNKLRGEIWIDLAQAAELGGDAQLAVQKLEAGEGIEVSTAYWRELEEKPGSLAGEPFYGVARNLRPDHLALLLHQVGACSWKDGCGTPRVNAISSQLSAFSSEKRGDEMASETMQINAGNTGVMVALYPTAGAEQALALRADQLPDGATVIPANEIHLTLGFLGDLADGSVQIDQGRLLEIVMNYAATNPIIRGRVSGIGRFNTSDSDGMQAFYASYDCDYLAMFRNWLVDWLPVYRGHGFTPHITLAYLPSDAATPNILPADQELVFDRIGVAWGGAVTLFPLQGEAAAEVANNEKVFNPGGMAKNAVRALARLLGFHGERADSAEPNQPAGNSRRVNLTEEVVMGKSDLVVKLSANSRCPFDKADLEAMSESALAKLDNALSANCGSAAANPLQGNTQASTEKPVANTQGVDDLADLRKLAGEIQAMGGISAIQSAMAEIKGNADEQKAALVGELKGNERCAFGEEELKAMSTETLRKLAASLRPVNYAGRGGPRGNSSEASSVPAAPAVLLAKESDPAVGGK